MADIYCRKPVSVVQVAAYKEPHTDTERANQIATQRPISV